MIRKKTFEMTSLTNTDLSAVMQLLDEYNTLAGRHAVACLDFIDKNQGTIQAYSEVHEEVEMGFNIFDRGLFDKEHHEAFHSKLLEILLKYEEGGKKKILRSFIDFLNEKQPQYEGKRPPEKRIELDAESAKIKTERTTRGRPIDLLIYQNDPKRAIIIENKLNDAVDQPNQLSDYRDGIKEEGYEVLAVVYTPRSPDKKPADQEEVKDLLYILPSFNGKGTDMYNWICAAQHDISDINANAILKQYARLLKKIGRNTMSYTVLDKFYEKLDAEKYKLALSMRDMLNGFSAYLAWRMKEHWEGERAKYEKKLPFKKIWTYKETTVALEFDYDGKLHVVDIICFEDRYEMQLFEKKDDSNGKPETFPKEALEKVGEKENWSSSKNETRAIKIFSFDNPQESENRVNEYLSAFFKKLFANV